MKILISGTFDNLHPGHKFVITEASKRGYLHVVVSRDVTVEHIKGRKPDQGEEARMNAIHHAFPNVSLHLGDDHDYLKRVLEVRPDLILLGYDQRMPPNVDERDLPCPTERLPAFEPDKWKSSLL